MWLPWSKDGTERGGTFSGVSGSNRCTRPSGEAITAESNAQRLRRGASPAAIWSFVGVGLRPGFIQKTKISNSQILIVEAWVVAAGQSVDIRPALPRLRLPGLPPLAPRRPTSRPVARGAESIRPLNQPAPCWLSRAWSWPSGRCCTGSEGCRGRAEGPAAPL